MLRKYDSSESLHGKSGLAHRGSAEQRGEEEMVTFSISVNGTVSHDHRLVTVAGVDHAVRVASQNTMPEVGASRPAEWRNLSVTFLIGRFPTALPTDEHPLSER